MYDECRCRRRSYQRWSPGTLPLSLAEILKGALESFRWESPRQSLRLSRQKQQRHTLSQEVLDLVRVEVAHRNMRVVCLDLRVRRGCWTGRLPLGRPRVGSWGRWHGLLPCALLGGGARAGRALLVLAIALPLPPPTVHTVSMAHDAHYERHTGSPCRSWSIVGGEGGRSGGVRGRRYNRSKLPNGSCSARTGLCCGQWLMLHGVIFVTSSGQLTTASRFERGFRVESWASLHEWLGNFAHF